MFKLHSEYSPTGDQPQAIDYLAKGIEAGKKFQTNIIILTETADLLQTVL